MPLVMPLTAVTAGDARQVGPKAANLARMVRAGLPVPPGFCITAAAYRDHIGRNGLAKRIDQAATAAPEAMGAILAGLREAIAAAPPSGGLGEEVRRHWESLGAAAVAVRSSATAEDLPGASFAGQHDSFLGIRDVGSCLRAIAGCWASLWSERAFDYRRRAGLGGQSAAMAVIVQAMAPAEASGVMFTADPASGRRDCAVIEAALGLGEAVVAGLVTPDRVIVSKRVFRVEQRAAGNKAVEVVADPSGGVRRKPVEAARAAAPCLDDATAGRLALLGADIEALLGGPQDVEWAAADGKLHILQARPITALPPAPQRCWEDRQIWTAANVRDAAPDAMTPMTWSFIGPAVVPLFGPGLRMMGVREDGSPIFGLVGGRVYFNVNCLAAMFRGMPGGTDRTLGALFGGGGLGADAPTAVRMLPEDLPAPAPLLRRLALLPELLAWCLRAAMRKGPAMLARFRSLTGHLHNQAWRALGDVDLARQVKETASLVGHRMFAPSGSTLMLGMGCAMLLMELCRRWLGDADGRIGNRLLSGLGGLEDAEAGHALWRLAVAARAEPAVEAVIGQEESFRAVQRRLERTPGGWAFLTAWDGFMREHGHHTRGEIEMANPRWSERPDYVLGMVRSYLAGLDAADPLARARQLARERRALAGQCLARLRDPIRRGIFAGALRRAQAGLRFKETSKSIGIRWLAVIRQMLLELGGRFARRGLLERSEDVFLLEMAELEPIARGRWDGRPAVERRRVEYKRNAALDPPLVVFGRYDGQPAPSPVVDGRSGLLQGMGVSPGLAAGKARIILHAGDGLVLPGEVLIAPFTDPAWTLYFLNAAAIVMDQGGVLSHGSIIAREYGIPCVVNVGPATRVLRTGQTVEVDGTHGTVRLLE